MAKKELSKLKEFVAKDGEEAELLNATIKKMGIGDKKVVSSLPARKPPAKRASNTFTLPVKKNTNAPSTETKRKKKLQISQMAEQITDSMMQILNSEEPEAISEKVQEVYSGLRGRKITKFDMLNIHAVERAKKDNSTYQSILAMAGVRTNDKQDKLFMEGEITIRIGDRVLGLPPQQKQEEDKDVIDLVKKDSTYDEYSYQYGESEKS